MTYTAIVFHVALLNPMSSTLPQTLLRDMQAICDVGAGSLQTLADALSVLDPPPVNPSQLFAQIRDSLGDEDAAESVMRQSIAMNQMMRAGTSVDEVFDGIGRTLHSATNWPHEYLEKWDEVGSHFREVACTDACKMVSATIDLSYEYSNLFRSARILTDIRPIFDRDATEILGAAISYTLRLGFTSGSARQEFSVAMDEQDIVRMKEQCDRALKKAKTAKLLMVDKADVPTSISGEVADADEA